MILPIFSEIKEEILKDVQFVKRHFIILIYHYALVVVVDLELEQEILEEKILRLVEFETY